MTSLSLLPLLDRAIALAAAETDCAWSEHLGQLDNKIEKLREQIESRPSVPTELQDDYRKEIDAVTLENMQLTTKLEQTAAALKRAKSAYKEEVKHNSVLEHKLDDLEQRLLSVVRKGR